MDKSFGAIPVFGYSERREHQAPFTSFKSAPPADKKAESLKPTYNKLVLACAILTSLLGLGGLLSYALNIPWLRWYFSDAHSMVLTMATASGLFFLGLAIATILYNQPYEKYPRWFWPIRYVSIAVPAGIGLYWLWKYVADPAFNFLDLSSYALYSVPFLTASFLALSAFALMIHFILQRSEGAVSYFVGIPAITVLNIGFLCLIGHFYDIPLLYSFRMAIPTGISAVLVAMALLISSIPFRGLLLPVLSETPKARLMAWLSIVSGLTIIHFSLNLIAISLRDPALMRMANQSLDLRSFYTILILATTVAATALKVIGLRGSRYFSDSMQYGRQQERAAERESVIRGIVQTIHGQLPLENIFNEVANQLGTYLQADHCFIWLMDPTRQAFTPPAGTLPAERGEEYATRLAAPFCRPTEAPFRFSLHGNGVNDEAFTWLLQAFSAENGLAYAIHYRQTCLGVLFLLNHHDRTWTKEELKSVQEVANQTGVAIYQSELYQKEQIRAKQLEMVAKFNQTALAGVELPVLLSECVQTVANTLNVKFAKVMERKTNGEETFVFRAVAGFDPALVGRELTMEEEPHGAYTLKRLEPVVVNDITKETRFQPSALHAEYNLISGISVVIYGSNNRPYGVLEAHDDQKRKFMQNDVHFLQALANILGIAMERKQAENALRESQQALAQSNRDLEHFATIASHDLQAPLRKTRSFIDQIIEDEQGAFKPESMDLLHRIQRALDGAQNLVGDLLALSKVIQTGRPFQKVELSDILRKALTNLEVQIREKDAKIEAGRLDSLMGDAVQLEQLLQNLVENSLKYQPRGQKPVIRIHSDCQNSTFCDVVVEDNGIGFNPDQADRIFQPFERLHGKSSPYSGTGVGLTICKRIVERHGGTIQAESQPGQGSRFTIRLPRKIR